MEKFKHFKVRLLNKLEEDVSEWKPYKRRRRWCLFHNHFIDISRIWNTFLKIPDREEIDVSLLMKKTFKVIKSLCALYDDPWHRYHHCYDDDDAYDELIKTLHKVGYKPCGVFLKRCRRQCFNMCTVGPGKCGVHSQKERRKIKIHQFLKDRFDPIGLRDVVNITAEYV